MKVHVLRLTENTEVVDALQKLVEERLPNGGCVLAGIGSVKRATLRYATREEGGEKVEDLKGPFEVLSLSGTLSRDGLHLHTSLGTQEGQTLGGHVKGNLVTQTTMELVVGEMEEVCLTRMHDVHTGFLELVVTPVKKEVTAGSDDKNY